MDSLYKGYPVGQILLWRTRERLKSERDLGPFRLRELAPDLPIEYVLDGQQRITSIFGVFQTELDPLGDTSAFNVFFDLSADEDVQDSQFIVLRDSEVDAQKHFPLRSLFDTVEYRKATSILGDAEIERIDGVQSRFKEVWIPSQTFETNDRTSVGIVFERVNRLGVELDTLQLLSAWTWSDDFDLQQEFSSLGEELEPFGFKDVGEDVTLLLRCCAAVVTGDPGPKSLINVNGAQVRERFERVRAGIWGAIDFVKNNFSVATLDNLPYATVLVPLTVFFAEESRKSVGVSDHQRRMLVRWFWRACFGNRYGRVVMRTLESDIVEVLKLRRGEDSNLGNFAVDVSEDFFMHSRFSVRNVNTKTFVLLLAQQKPLSFISGQPVDLGRVLSHYNRSEFHHLYPQKFLKDTGVDPDRASSLANFAFMSSIDNKQIGGLAPSQYRSLLDGDETQILRRALCPDVLWDDNYEAFLMARATRLLSLTQKLIL